MFKPIDSKVNFVELERKWLSWWYKSGLVKKYLHKNDKSKKRFSFLDGPITANNPMGVHHGWGRTLKDFFQKYKNMQGFKQRFQNGFDNQGLWVEVGVEKELGFKDKKDIEKYGIGKFVNKCKERTLKFAEIQTEQSKRLGYFMDWENSYYTMSDENNYMIWSFLKECHEKGYLYKGKDVVPWCPRCGTAISQHEILTEAYNEITHEAIYLKFPIVGRKNEYLLVWTTTPWTLVANVAVAVNPKLKYVKAKVGDDTYYLSEGTLSVLTLGSPRGEAGYKILDKMSGEKLVGLKYLGPFDEMPAWKETKAEHQVFPADFVGEEEGTGLVHIAPGCGEEDYDLCQNLDVPVIAPIDEAGRYLENFDFLTGKNTKETNSLIFENLKQKNFVYKIHRYAHRYPTCWRCKSELVFRLVEEWYISMEELRHQMMTVAKKIKWIPSWGMDRELDWLKNMSDWLISKKRYWGLALPIWECGNGHFEVIGSEVELKEKAISGWNEFKGHSPHRPWIDEVKIKCPVCGKTSSRIKDVGNPWLDAGIIPYSTLKYRTDKEYWQQWFPADFVTECFPGQFKNWFYSLIAMSTVLENQEPFKTLLGHALVRDEKGEEMHKSKGNAIEFNEAAEKMGVDVMRWMYLSQNPTLDLNFGFNIGDETRRRFHLLLWNVYNFFITYANLDHWKPKDTKLAALTKLDKWILVRLNEMTGNITKAIDNFDTSTATTEIQNFVNDLSTWYVRRSRDRVGPMVYSVFYEVFVTLAKILAPFTPFLAEEIYQNINGEQSRTTSLNTNSVHLTDWPQGLPIKAADKKLLSQMEWVRKICELGQSARREAGIKIRQPLGEFSIFNFQFTTDKELVLLIKEELNVKEVLFKKGKGELKVKLDTTITQELREEGEARDLVRQIQDLRKTKGAKLDQKIIVYGPSFPKKKVLLDYIKKETLAEKLLPGETLRIG